MPFYIEIYILLNKNTSLWLIQDRKTYHTSIQEHIDIARHLIDCKIRDSNECRWQYSIASRVNHKLVFDSAKYYCQSDKNVTTFSDTICMKCIIKLFVRSPVTWENKITKEDRIHLPESRSPHHAVPLCIQPLFTPMPSSCQNRRYVNMWLVFSLYIVDHRKD